MAVFEGQERRMPKIEACLKEYGFESLDAVKDYCLEKGIDVDKIVKSFSPSLLRTLPGHTPWVSALL